eukprot:2135192-Rhodomonas_salina.1
MQSPALAVRLATGTLGPVCPPGMVLQLEATEHGQLGWCALCPPGSYSLHPLVGTPSRPNIPACLACPAGGVCPGGAAVQFGVGRWGVVEGRFALESCPPRHQLIPAAASADQRCDPCLPSQYQLAPGGTCVDCPKGARCTSGALQTSDGLDETGEVTWAADGGGERLWLRRCPRGF